MDFMFEDEVDEVGSDVEAYCPKCKADTTHVVISKYEDEIRRVQCNPCGDVHSFRKPRGEVEEDVPEPVAARKRAALKKATWEEFFAKHNEKNAKPYEFREQYRENTMVTHPKFGVGFVSEVVSDSKVEITFKDARRVLVHNRKDIPGLPLAAEGDGTPTPPKPAAKPDAAKTAKAPAAKDGVPAGKAAAKPASAPPASKAAPKPELKAVPKLEKAEPVKPTSAKPADKDKAEKPAAKADKAKAEKPVKAEKPAAKPAAKPEKAALKPSKPAAAVAKKPAAKPVAKPVATKKVAGKKK